MKAIKVCVCFLVLFMSSPLVAAVRINEICADNKESLLTAAGDAADWIELYNDGGSAVSLEDWSLTDSKSNPRKFVFPSGVSVAPHGYLVVFADGSGTPVQNGEVHANFSLSKSGEYLALIDPGGEAVSAFTFPPQFRDVSYGYAPKEIIPIGDGAPCVFWVPDGSLPQNVVKHNGVGALGFADAQVQGNFTVKYYEMNSNVRHIDTAESMLANPAYWKSGYPVAGQYQTVNFMRSGTTGIFGGYAAFPSLPGSNQEEFVVTAEGGVYVPSPGLWTFAVASDDGFRLRITGHGVSFMSEYEGTRGIQPTFGVFNFPVAGVYSVNLIMFQGNGGAGLEFAVAQGDQQNYNVSTFSLVGGAACPVLHAGAFGALIETNIKTQMDGGAQKRLQMRSEWSFVIDELPDENDAFTLYLRYSDGYQAWLAGTLLGEANIPVPVNPPLGGFHDRSPASVQRPVEDYMTWEVISVPTALLTVGTNTLSVYGLRHSATNENFFLQVRLVQNTKALHLAYFKDPTPGAANAAAHTAPTPAVTISEPHGYKTAPFTATLSCDDPAAVIRYTLNGSVPTKSNSIIYTNPLPVSATTVIRAAVIDPESVFQNTATVSWLFLEQVLTQGFPGSPWPSGSSNGQTYEYTMRSDIRAAYPTEIRTGFTNAIPTLSIVMHQDDFSGATQGIYSNPGNEGIGWERPISLELIDPVRGPQKEFQKNGGLRIRGAQSRSKGNPKHAFRIYFRREYSGDNKLLFPMFDAEGAEEFNRFDLRCTSNGSWGQQNDANETFLRDVYSRDCQRDLGVAYTRSRPYHVFINGVYWGLYETQERPESHYGVTYFGGANKDWDALKTSHSDRNLYAVDGNTDALNALWNCTFPQGGYAPSGSTAGNYMRMLGRNPDGTPNPAYPAYLDETNLIARVLVMHHTADPDSPISDWGGHGNNMAALYNRADPDGFKWFCHDSEFAFGLNGTYNPAYDFTMMGSGFTDLRRFNPNTLHQRLCAHPDYKMHFADQVQKHLLGGGALTIAKSHERWRARMDMLGDAVVPESARWGRGKTVATWSNACNTVLNFMTQREPNLLNHYRQRGWFPALAAPAHDLAAPLVDIGTPVTVSAPGAFYYTLDGSDPRLPGGGVNPAAIAVGNPAAPPSPPVTLLANGSVWKYYDNGNAPANNNGASWKSPAYSDAAWPQGPSTLGFQGSATVNPVATVTKRYVNGTSGAQVTTTYFRHTFNFSGAANVTALNVTMLIDDGAVVYLNGTEVIRYNMNPGTPTYDDYAASNLGSPAQNTYYNYTIPVQHLQEGANVLAAEVHQSNATSTDLYFDFTLSATSAAGGGGGGAPGGGSVTIIAETNHTVMARCYDGAEWSPLTDLAFTTEPPPDNTLPRASKLMYAPPDPDPARGRAEDAGERAQLRHLDLSVAREQARESPLRNPGRLGEAADRHPSDHSLRSEGLRNGMRDVHALKIVPAVALINPEAALTRRDWRHRAGSSPTARSALSRIAEVRSPSA
ncbi:MAG: lamin tail domain-containing protein [Kiritimatiellaeota bacterium]|nr:lamin tail domain-containing protein [Kiritimatiellota bacterium]